MCNIIHTRTSYNNIFVKEEINGCFFFSPTKFHPRIYRQGFEILAFPCNQFLYQEPGSSEEAEQFACTRFKAEYPIFQKVKVNGSSAAPVYKFLKASKGGFFGSSIKWNFTKFLVDKDGHVIKRYGTSTSPFAIEVSLSLSLSLSAHQTHTHTYISMLVISKKLWEKFEGL
ncbi:hypothetical protein BUALT_Bualt02G0222600 [Buddleja alternifolia]|uniref:Glutathione peroxidase n=1 Tax=Buddleja alternifolia TaxID=168488 RepID=A0AAV6Y9G1_9LAMI|nr:hypothetical protein BUALT_Bualt02G0222600 [Buddleja alternifolia]